MFLITSSNRDQEENVICQTLNAATPGSALDALSNQPAYDDEWAYIKESHDSSEAGLCLPSAPLQEFFGIAWAG